MKKKLLECPRHGLSLHRCKRRCWSDKRRDRDFANEYTEKCFKCIGEGRHKKIPVVVEKKKKHISFSS